MKDLDTYIRPDGATMLEVAPGRYVNQALGLPTKTPTPEQAAKFYAPCKARYFEPVLLGGGLVRFEAIG